MAVLERVEWVNNDFHQVIISNISLSPTQKVILKHTAYSSTILPTHLFPDYIENQEENQGNKSNSLHWTFSGNESSWTPEDHFGSDEQHEYIFDRTGLRLTFLLLYTIVFCCCFFGNLLVILVVTLHWRMRSITNFCLANLAFADLCVGIFCVYQNIITYLMESWVFGEFMCKMYHFINSLSTTASVLILVVICIERYLAIIHPMTCKQMLTLNRLRATIAFVWILSAFLSSPRFYYFNTLSMPLLNGKVEILCLPNRLKYDSKMMDMISLIVLFLVPLLIITVLYTHIGIVLWKSSNAKLSGTSATPSVEESSSSTATATAAVYYNNREATEQNFIETVNFSLYPVNSGHRHVIHRDNSLSVREESPRRQGSRRKVKLGSPFGHEHDHVQQTQTCGQCHSQNSCLAAEPVSLSVSTSAEATEPIVFVKFKEVKSGRKRLKITRKAECTILLNPRKSRIMQFEQSTRENFRVGAEGNHSIGSDFNRKDEFEEDEEDSLKNSPVLRRNPSVDSGISVMKQISANVPVRCCGCHQNHNFSHYRVPNTPPPPMTPKRIRKLRVVRSNKYGNHALKSRRRIIRMLVILVLAFALCHLPFHGRKVWQYWSPTWAPYEAGGVFSTLFTPITFLIMYSNSGINPILYAFMSKKFRLSCRDLIYCRMRRALKMSRNASARSHNAVAL